jgi:hypothetical protein
MPVGGRIQKLVEDVATQSFIHVDGQFVSFDSNDVLQKLAPDGSTRLAVVPHAADDALGPCPHNPCIVRGGRHPRGLDETELIASAQ